MKVRFKAENPDYIEMTLTITMTMAQWKKFQQQLVQQWPSWDVSSIIDGMIRKAEMEFRPTEEP